MEPDRDRQTDRQMETEITDNHQQQQQLHKHRLYMTNVIIIIVIAVFITLILIPRAPASYTSLYTVLHLAQTRSHFRALSKRLNLSSSATASIHLSVPPFLHSKFQAYHQFTCSSASECTR